MRSGLKPVLSFAAALLCVPGANGAFGFDRNMPGEFDYYVLVLSWTPTYCRGEGKLRNDAQCDLSKPRAFLLHGLWPQYEKGWPEHCHMPTRPWVPDSVIAEMRDIMPNKNLLIHEYRTHGTCSGLEPEQFFAAARQAYNRVSVPASFLSPNPGLSESPDEIEHAFLDANPWLKPEMISITCRRGALLAIRVCFGRDLAPRACGANEDQRRLCPLPEIAVPPPAQ